MKRRATFLSLAFVLAACTIGDAASPTGTAPVATVAPTEPQALPCDVDAVLANHCRQCHSSPTQFGAPMPLMTWGDTQAPAPSDPSKRVFEDMGQRIHDDAHPMPQPPNARLDAAATATLDGWIAAGAPASSGERCTTTPPVGNSNPLSCTPDVHMDPASPYAMPADSDDRYTCYGFDVTIPAGSKKQIIAIAPRIGNTKIVHHLVLYVTDTGASSTPLGCDFGVTAKARLIYGWAPGTGALELPAEAGYPEEGTVHFLAQIHYSNPQQLTGQTDASGFDFCTTSDLRPNDADAVLFGDDNFTIPPHGTLDRTCDYTWPAASPPIHVFAALPHMHQIGTSIHSELRSTGAPVVDLGTRDPWDFANQIYVPLSATIKPGDVVHTECKWANPTDTAVSFGPFTSDEMCNSYTLYYPRINTPGWGFDDAVGSSTCTSK